MTRNRQKSGRRRDASQRADDAIEHFLHLLDWIDRRVFAEKKGLEFREADDEQLDRIAGLDLPERRDGLFDDVDRLPALGCPREKAHFPVDRRFGITRNPMQKVDDVSEV